jgi:hypothetical protein
MQSLSQMGSAGVGSRSARVPRWRAMSSRMLSDREATESLKFSLIFDQPLTLGDQGGFQLLFSDDRLRHQYLSQLPIIGLPPAEEMPDSGKRIVGDSLHGCMAR